MPVSNILFFMFSRSKREKYHLNNESIKTMPLTATVMEIANKK